MTPAKGREGGTLIEALSARMWPAPTVGDARNSRNATANRSPGSSHHSGTTLSDAIRMIPTPTARLGHRRGAQAKRYFDPNRSNDLDDYVAATGTPGSLNPAWVEWLMGYPAGWTDSEDSATPSSPKS